SVFPSVENLRIEEGTLRWNEVIGAGGYNIYYLQGGPSKHGEREYLTTVRQNNSLDNIQPGVYSVIAFSLNETLFSDWTSAESIWLHDDGSVSRPTATNDTTVEYFGLNDERYLVETNCSNSPSPCIASCKTDQTSGYATGGYCYSGTATINSTGSKDRYSCHSTSTGNIIVAGVYCVR
ncbi:MAG: hypothetical protein KTR32_43620, partial [Granulosicoccus sp.]|nr:hypothetical protein [Granulosicoccus sp.]